MFAKVIIALATTAVIGTLSVGTDAWARGGGGRGKAHGMNWGGKGMMGMHGKSGHGRHFPHQAHHGKHDDGHGKHDDKNKMGIWQRGRGGKDFRREWQAGGGGGGGGGYGGGGSVGDFCQGTLCQGVWYQVTESPKRSRDEDRPVDK